MPADRNRSRHPVLIWVIVTVAISACSTHRSAPKPILSDDLRPFGFVTDAHSEIVGSFTDLNFLSNDLLLVTINSRVYRPIERSSSDSPVSKLLLFDLSKRALIKSIVFPVEKDSGSVRAVANGQFVVLNQSGLHLCGPTLECHFAIQTPGPLFVSPRGTRIVVGGNGQTDQKLLDGATLAEIERFSWNNPSVIPGDDGLLVRGMDGLLHVRLPGQPDKQIPFGGSGVWPEARFVSDSRIAEFESDKTLVIAKTDGTAVFRVPIAQRWRVEDIVPTRSGSRFCLHEAGYTRFNSILNFWDIESSRLYNTESVTVISLHSGERLLNLSWDPRPYVGYLPSPSLSPDEHRIAIVRGGFLEVYEFQ